MLYQPYTFQDNSPFGKKSSHSWALGLTVRTGGASFYGFGTVQVLVAHPKVADLLTLSPPMCARRSLPSRKG